MKKILSFLLRIDNLNRILIFVSMALFLVVPSMVLYFINESTQTMDIVIACIVLIGIVLGGGTIALVRPIRTTLLYFIELLIVIIIEFNDFHPTEILDGINYYAIYCLELSYCAVAAFINVVVLWKISKRRTKPISATNEDTNEDTVYDFLNATSSNDKIEEDIENIMDGNQKRRMSNIKKVKFSRVLRILSFAIVFISFLGYFFAFLEKDKGNADDTMYRLLLSALLLVSLTFFFSLKFPRDFKYLYFYEAAFFDILAIICSSEAMLKPVFLILSLVILFLSFLVTLIVEGRTWTGSSSS